jgi:U3 small nucleolar RNA-associated protein 10
MSSSGLLKQLKQLKQRDEVASHLTTKLNASLLFDLKEAGLVTIEKVRELAVEGYHNLATVLPQVTNYQALIFETKRIDRMKLTPSENEELSSKLQNLIQVLSGNFLNINTLRILEYLLRNYEIHRFESETIIISFLAYHTTGPYTKLLQNLDLSSPTNKYHFLFDHCRTGSSLNMMSLIH